MNESLFKQHVGGVMLGCLLIFVAPRRRRIWSALGLLILMAGALTLTACGGSGHSTGGTTGSPGTPAGSYMVTVTASSGSIKANTQIDVMVQ